MSVAGDRSGASQPSGVSGPSRPGSSAPRSGPGRTRARAGQYLCSFWMAGQPFALDAVLVGEVLAVPRLLPVPLTPPWLLGLHNLRGIALAVVDLGRVLDLPGEPPAPGSALNVLVLRSEDLTVGIRIDRVDAVRTFESVRVEPLASPEHPAIRALVRLPHLTATLLDEVQVAARLGELRLRRQGAGSAPTA